VQEYYNDNWNGDFVRLLKARLPEADFPQYAKNLGLTERFDPVTHADVDGIIHNLRFVSGQKWFDPPPADQTTYFKHQRGPHTHSYSEVLWHSNGFVYFIAFRV